jgi:hypothetical protein
MVLVPRMIGRILSPFAAVGTMKHQGCAVLPAPPSAAGGTAA